VLGTPVAIKLIHSELKDDAEAVQRFLNEARTTAALGGEHIARVFDCGLLPTGEPYLVMEQLDGVALDDYLRDRGQLSLGEAIDIVLQACKGLSEAHAAGLVHRDIKPANLFLASRSDGGYTVKILDFGIAKQRVDRDGPGLTDPGRSLGSPWYMSPEQMIKPADVDARADVWSLGVLLFELLTHARPFDGENVPQVCASVLTATPPGPSAFRPRLSPELDALVLRCLEKDPERRFGSVEALARALEPWAFGAQTSAGFTLEDAEASSVRRKPGVLPAHASYGSLSPLNADADLPRLPLRRRGIWALVVGLLALALLAGGAWLQQRDPALLRSAVSAVSASRVELRIGPQLLPDVPDDALVREVDPPLLMQRVQRGRALVELDRDEAKPEESGEPLTPEEIQRKTENYEAWLKAQGLTRLNELE
jgi:serine/threonine protein kinase